MRFLGAYDANSLAGLPRRRGAAAVAVLMALFCIRYGMNQIVIGIALTLGAEGLTALLHHFQFGRTRPGCRAAAPSDPGSRDIPVVGPALFDHHPLVYLGSGARCRVAGLPAHHVGLNLQAAGDKPARARRRRRRLVREARAAVLATGALAGLGGAYMAEIGAGIFVPFMTGGAGFIGIVLAMLARGRPLWVLLGALLFGVSQSLTRALQVAGIDIPTDVVADAPFLMVMASYHLRRHAGLPPALGLPYVRGAR